MEFENNAFFWQKVDTLLLLSDEVIDRPKGSAHPQYKNLIYPTDYGYIKDSLSSTEQHIPVYVGSSESGKVEALVVCVDILKKELDVKFLVSCTKEEQLDILRFLNQTDNQKTVIIRRGKEIPDWAQDN